MDQGMGSGHGAHWLRLRIAAEAELGRGPWALGFHEPVRHMFESHRTPARAQELNRLCLMGLLAVLCLVITIDPADLVRLPNLETALHCLATSLLALPIAWLAFRPHRDAAVLECGALGMSCCFTLATLAAIAARPADIAIPTFFLFSLPVIGVLAFVRLRFPAALVFVATTAAALALVLAGRRDLPAALLPYPLVFLLAAALPALAGVFRMEGAARRAYLTGVLQNLHIEQLAFENGRLNQLSTTDAVTGAANRRQLEAVLETMCAQPPGGEFLLLADVDYFKRFNDRYGHLAGDDCLRQITSTMRAELRRTDLLARFGGEEFAMVLSCCTLDHALATAERIRDAVARHVVVACGSAEIVTVSIGIAEHVVGANAARLIAAADDALYAAKRAGRNRVRCSGVAADAVG